MIVRIKLLTNIHGNCIRNYWLLTLLSLYHVVFLLYLLLSCFFGARPYYFLIATFTFVNEIVTMFLTGPTKCFSSLFLLIASLHPSEHSLAFIPPRTLLVPQILFYIFSLYCNIIISFTYCKYKWKFRNNIWNENPIRRLPNEESKKREGWSSSNYII